MGNITDSVGMSEVFTNEYYNEIKSNIVKLYTKTEKETGFASFRDQQRAKEEKIRLDEARKKPKLDVPQATGFMRLMKSHASILKSSPIESEFTTLEKLCTDDTALKKGMVKQPDGTNVFNPVMFYKAHKDVLPVFFRCACKVFADQEQTARMFSHI